MSNVSARCPKIKLKSLTCCSSHQDVHFGSKEIWSQSFRTFVSPPLKVHYQLYSTHELPDCHQCPHVWDIEMLNCFWLKSPNIDQQRINVDKYKWDKKSMILRICSVIQIEIIQYPLISSSIKVWFNITEKNESNIYLNQSK